MSRHAKNGLYLFLAFVVCPLLGWNLAVSAAGHGYGWSAFFIMLLGLPLLGAAVGGWLLRRSSRVAALGSGGAVVASIVLFAVLFFLALRTLTF
jgi:hypothetical protein